jgi:hypothetical protein
VISVSGKTVYAGSHQEMCAGLLSSTEQLINIALAISHMHDAFWLGEQCRGLLQVLKPAVALLLFNGYAGRVNLALERVGTMKLIPRPELDRSQSKWKPLFGYNQTGVHQNAARRVIAWKAFTGIHRLHLFQNANSLGILALIGELSRVMKNQHWSAPSS